VLIIVSEVTLL